MNADVIHAALSPPDSADAVSAIITGLTGSSLASASYDGPKTCEYVCQTSRVPQL